MKSQFTAKQVDTVTRLYASTDTQVIADSLGLSRVKVYNLAYRLGLNKSPDYMKALQGELGNDLIKVSKKTRFAKGHVPANKGKKITIFMSPEGLERSKKTRFQKGNKPKNYVPYGTKIFRKDSEGRYYWRIKLEGIGWKHLHVHLWEEHYGAVEKGKIIVFKDKNSSNCVIENLEAITRVENMRRNTIHQYPEELKSIIKLNKKLNRTISEKQTQRPQ